MKLIPATAAARHAAACLIVLGFTLATNTYAQEVTALGITEPFLDSTLSAPVAGIVAQRRCKEGDVIRRGDVLVELDKRLEELDVIRRKTVYDQAENEYTVTKKLFDKPNSSTPGVDVEKRKLERDVAKVEFELAEELLRRRHIAAPFDGSVAEIFLQVGEACQIQQPMVRLVDTRQCYFVSNVEAKAGHNLKPGQPVSLEIDAGRGAPVRVTGKVNFVSPVVDPASGLMKVKVVFENANGTVRPGVAGKMTF
ncbi:MAG: efflux RND transporter periplasmic adaptor subunit [Verrucomicrobiales bacterium]|nr:efflux RND transporter periplasmic adaptor subunit [Verrucomicrobiales bacterium]